MTNNRALRSFRVRQNENDIFLKIWEHPNKNDYVLVDPNIWVRNFTKNVASAYDINNLYNDNEFELLLNNEMAASFCNVPYLSNPLTKNKNAIILNNGYGYKEAKEIIESSEREKHYIICLNNTFKMWSNIKRMPDLFIVNNPYADCLSQIPLKTEGTQCICSTRTNMNFYENYKGYIFKYASTENQNFVSGKLPATVTKLDEYRNPVCSAIHFCWLNNIQNILLIGCTVGTSDEREGTQKHGEFYKLPAQIQSDKIIDSMMMWYKLGNKDSTLCSYGKTGSFKFATELYYEDLTKII